MGGGEGKHAAAVLRGAHLGAKSVRKSKEVIDGALPASPQGKGGRSDGWSMEGPSFCFLIWMVVIRVFALQK